MLASFTLAFVICFLFSVGLFAALEYAEWVLFDQRTETDISTFIHQYASDPDVIALPRENFEVYVAKNGDESGLPAYLRDLPEDADEVVRDGRELDLHVEEDGDTTFYFLFDQTTFDAFDQLLSVFVPIFILLVCAIAVALGLGFSNRVFNPVAKLAERVNALESPAGAQAGAEARSSDEIEILAQAIEAFQVRVAELLAREREFSSDLSHELRTPLMGIQAAADNLVVSVGKQERVAELSLRIQKRCSQMRALVDAMLSLARDPHSLENDFRDLRLAEVVRDEVEAAGPHVESRGVNIRILEDGDPHIFTSTAILSVVIGNLLRNAILHSNSQEIHLQLTPRGCCIRDFGQGVSEGLKEKIFDRYASAGTHPARDLGIGLSLVRRLCSHFKWPLVLDSTPGRGTSITVDFGQSILAKV